MERTFVKLYRPIGLKEFELIKDSNFKKFPPRLEWQPIFYPVLDFDYACKIAEDWNTGDEFSGYVGFVTEFEIPSGYFSKFEIQNVGASNHNEIWVPAEELEEFNSKINEDIRIVKRFYGEKFKGERKN